jgi:hypothetical protein
LYRAAHLVATQANRIKQAMRAILVFQLTLGMQVQHLRTD